MPVPNPVQRRSRFGDKYRIASDTLIEPCADEGGTFRDKAPERQADPFKRSPYEMAFDALIAVAAVSILAVVVYASTSA